MTDNQSEPSRSDNGAEPDSKDIKKPYCAPALLVIGRITALTGNFKNLNYLDNTNVAAWKSVL